ncbi:MerR family transcriptional regulator [Kribbella sp. CA-253562]|uniref:MerR family transcriptional regulator n=1 Tax=Kribbella sp. CA-253562 TaxID=3239942 RepID=UPI003D904A57
MTRVAESLTVGAAAALVGISVRTLHHWDSIGLVVPSDRTPAGYRVYSAADIARIHRVLVYRELGIPLADIARMLDDPDTDPQEHLRRQRTELADRIDRLRTMLQAVDRMLDATGKGIQLTPEQQSEIFGASWRLDWVEEAENRWSGTPQWAQYADRAATRTTADWQHLAAEVNTLNADLAAAVRNGVSPGSPEANALAERHRAGISQHFDCTHAMHVCLARNFTDDPGYAEYYDAFHPGLASWLQAAINANAQTHGVDPATATWPAQS